MPEMLVSPLEEVLSCKAIIPTDLCSDVDTSSDSDDDNLYLTGNVEFSI
jgi:hypothetical protein